MIYVNRLINAKNRRAYNVRAGSVYDKIRAAGALAGWSEGTQLIVLSEFIENVKPHPERLVRWLKRLDEFLETKRKERTNYILDHD